MICLEKNYCFLEYDAFGTHKRAHIKAYKKLIKDAYDLFGKNMEILLKKILFRKFAVKPKWTLTFNEISKTAENFRSNPDFACRRNIWTIFKFLNVSNEQSTSISAFSKVFKAFISEKTSPSAMDLKNRFSPEMTHHTGNMLSPSWTPTPKICVLKFLFS